VIGRWIIGASLTLVGLQAVQQPRNNEGQQGLPWLAWEWPALFVLLMVAFFTRGTLLDQIPLAMHGDEAAMGLEARHVLDGSLKEPFVTGWLSHSVMWFFIEAGGLWLFGNTLAGLRLVPAFFGMAGVVACLLFVRMRYGRLIGWSSAILLAAYPLHIHFSRIALNNVVDPTFALLTFAVFFFAWRSGSLVAFVGAGMLAGFAQHFYFGARLIPALIVAVVLHQLLLNRAHVWRNWRGIMLMPLGFVSGIGPLLRHYLENPETIFARLKMVGLFQTGRYTELVTHGQSPFAVVFGQLWHAFGAYVSIPETGVFYASEYPLLRPFEALFFLAGLGIALWNWKRPEQFLLVLWIATTAIFGGALLVDAPQAMRYVFAAPAICICVALGMVELLDTIRIAVGFPARPALLASLVAVVVGYSACSGVQYYFGDYTAQQRYGYTRAVTAITGYLRTLHPNQHVYFLGAPRFFHDYSTIQFLAPDVRGTDIVDPLTTPSQVPAPMPGQRSIFVALGFREDELALVEARYPHGYRLTYPDTIIRGKSLFVVYEAP
jgi:4-amino-4-deoxy-L-arabinose transferase-like glycosyltransferase